MRDALLRCIVRGGEESRADAVAVHIQYEVPIVRKLWPRELDGTRRLLSQVQNQVRPALVFAPYDPSSRLESVIGSLMRLYGDARPG